MMGRQDRDQRQLFYETTAREFQETITGRFTRGAGGRPVGAEVALAEEEVAEAVDDLIVVLLGERRGGILQDAVDAETRSGRQRDRQ